MLPALAAATAAIDALHALAAPKSKATTGADQTSASPFEVSAAPTASDTPSTAATGSTTNHLSSGTMSTLLDAQSGPAASSASSAERLLRLLDRDGDGKVSQSEYVDKLGAGTGRANADKAFSKLDTNADGGVNLDELSAAVKGREAITFYTDAQQLILRRSQAAASTLAISA